MNEEKRPPRGLFDAAPTTTKELPPRSDSGKDAADRMDVDSSVGAK
jgi:hypothetical protein